MCEIKRGAVVLIQAGDPEISGAIAEGIVAARREATAAESTSSGPAGHLHQRGRLLGTEEAREVAKLVHVAVGNSKTADDYLILLAAAEQDYRKTERGPLGRLLARAIDIYALFIYALAEAHRAQDRVLGGRRG